MIGEYDKQRTMALYIKGTVSRAFVKSEDRLVEDFLDAYTAGIQLIKKDSNITQRSLAKWTRESDSYVLTKAIEGFRPIFKSARFVPDNGIENVLKDMATWRSVPQKFVGRRELFRDSGPLEKTLGRS
jgi:ABC-type nitrate/sulfonate/bicarbonate transport system substrate-binding protein